ncbi:MAG: hypothetical protein D6758_11090, partial [Gammaproteobacteria bacterium]
MPTLSPHGLTNRTERQIWHGQPVALRTNCPNPGALGIDRARERAVLDHIQSCPWAPRVLHWDEDTLVTAWVEGHAPPSGPQTDLTWLASALDAVHALPPPAGLAPLDMRDQIQRLLRSANHLPSTLAEEAQYWLTHYHPPASVCLCHHDWHPGNLIIHKAGWTLLDWEYAAPGDRVLDVASAVLGFGLDVIQQQTLAERTGLPSHQLSEAVALMTCVNALWHQVRQDHQDPSILTIGRTETPG